MAKDWLEIVRSIEAHYPKTQGIAQNQDENLRASLVDWANNNMQEVDQLQPWNLSYALDSSTTTTSGLQAYPMPLTFREIDRVFWVDTSGRMREILPATPNQARQLFGTGAIPPDGYPRRYSIEGTTGSTFGASQITLWPAPDSTGPVGGNYTIFIEGYASFSSMVETSGNITTGTATLTVPSGSPGFLFDNNIPASGAAVSVRGAGSSRLTNVAGSNFDNLLASWSAMGATTVTLTRNAANTVSNAQVFFNSDNWLIARFPKVILFGVCREVATYLKDDYQGWEQRYQHELELMQGWDERWQRPEITMFAAMAQQLRPAGRSLYYSPFSWWQGMP